MHCEVVQGVFTYLLWDSDAFPTMEGKKGEGSSRIGSGGFLTLADQVGSGRVGSGFDPIREQP